MPPDRLGAWLRDFDELLREHGLDGVPYGHFGDGCVHVRIDFPSSRTAASAGRSATSSPRAPEAARARRLAVGRARRRPGALGAAAADVRRGVARALRRGQGDLRPGQPAQPRQHRRPGAARRRPAPSRPRQPVTAALRLVHDGGVFGNAVHRCTGVGKCVAPTDDRRDVPVVPRDPRREGLHPRPLAGAAGGARRELVEGLADPAVAEALDLCLACKGCASDCPTGVDMATYKAEALHQKHDGPASGVRAATAAGPAAEVGGAGRADRAGGQPDDAARPGRAAGQGDGRHRPAAVDPGVRAARPCGKVAPTRPVDGRSPDVWIWADSFSDHFFPGNGQAAIRYLESVGLTARVIADDACCGLTWITTGQLDQARTIMAQDRGHAEAVRRVRGAGHRTGAVLPGHPAQRRGRADRRDGAS